MSCWLKKLVNCLAGPLRSLRSGSFRPRLEILEVRLTPAGNLAIANALLVDAYGHPVTAPDKGEEVFVQANWTTQGQPSAPPASGRSSPAQAGCSFLPPSPQR